MPALCHAEQQCVQITRHTYSLQRTEFVYAATNPSWRSFGNENAAASTENVLWREVPATDDSPQRSPVSKSALRAITNQPDVRAMNHYAGNICWQWMLMALLVLLSANAVWMMQAWQCDCMCAAVPMLQFILQAHACNLMSQHLCL